MNQDVERWTRELLAAGWKRRFATVWESPAGTLYRGPYGAWKVMKGIACDTHDDCFQGPCRYGRLVSP